MQAVGACFGGEYPKQPIGFEKQNGSYADDTEDDEENYTYLILPVNISQNQSR